MNRYDNLTREEVLAACRIRGDEIEIGYENAVIGAGRLETLIRDGVPQVLVERRIWKRRVPATN